MPDEARELAYGVSVRIYSPERVLAASSENGALVIQLASELFSISAIAPHDRFRRAPDQYEIIGK